MNAMSTSKYLDQTGLQHFWDKIKDHVDDKLSNVKAYVEVEPKSHTETTEERVEYEGTLVPESFDIRFGYETENEGTIEYHRSELISLLSNNVNPSLTNSALLSNTEYTFNFTLVPSISYSGFYIEAYFLKTNKDKINTYCGYTIVPDSEYEEWEGSRATELPCIKMTLPAIGSESQFKFNAAEENGTEKLIPENEQNMSVVLSNVDGTNYQLKFYWDYSEDIPTTETISRKELKTTLELNDEESVVINKPISGLLQDARLGKRSEYVIENVSSEGQYIAIITLNDETFDPREE